jgi:hypothetical protein
LIEIEPVRGRLSGRGEDFRRLCGIFGRGRAKIGDLGGDFAVGVSVTEVPRNIFVLAVLRIASELEKLGT